MRNIFLRELNSFFIFLILYKAVSINYKIHYAHKIKLSILRLNNRTITFINIFSINKSFGERISLLP